MSFTKLRFIPPAYSGDAQKDFNALLKAIGDHFLSLERPGALAVEEAEIVATNGVQFPATQNASTDANTLDDYEEGTATVTLTGSVTNPTTPVTTTLAYTKIGREVSFVAFFNGVDTTGAAGQIKITGLPFSAAQAYVGSVLMDEMGTYTGSPVALITGTEVHLYANNSAAVFSNVNHNVTASGILYVSGVYRV